MDIRQATPADAEALLGIYAPYVERTAITFEYEVPTPDEFRTRIARTLGRHPYLVAERDGRPVGYAYAGPLKEREAYDWAVETSVYVAWDDRGGGVGSALHEELRHELAAMGIQNMCACIAAPRGTDPYLTDRSIGFHTRLGYRMVGRFEQVGYKFGRWYDMVWMELHIGSHPVPAPRLGRA